jgi:AMP-activated protein kinase-like protein
MLVAPLLVVLGLLPAAVAGQVRASAGVGVGTIRHSGGRDTSSAIFTPELGYDSPTFTAALRGTLASLRSGGWSRQGRADVWLATPALGGMWAGIEVIGSGTSRTDHRSSAAAHVVAELSRAAPTWGIGIGAGPSTGWIDGGLPVTALHSRARLWAQRGAATYAVNVEPTRFLGAWFTDVSAGIAWSSGPMSATLWGASRRSAVYGSKWAGSGSVQFFPLPNAAIELSAGTYLPEPYEGFPGGGFVTAGVRVFSLRHPVAPATPPPTWPALVPERRGDSVVVRFRMPGAHSVAIAGDWDGWQQHPLSPSAGGAWQGVLALPAGTYRFTLVVDGTDWVVPAGVAVRKDGRGGIVGVLAAP